MVVKFRNNRTVELGNFLTFDEAWEIPGFIYWDADPGCIHTLIFLNIDHPNEFFPQKRQYLQWLVGNIPEARVENGRILSSYLMPIPPPVQYGIHRLLFLAYKQPRTTIEFSEPFLPALPLPKSRANWTLAEFVNKYDLIGPVAGNFYQINWQEEGNNLEDDKRSKIENKISL
ncbi:protein D2-like [Bemisia tabaci]|uniref:protein D2-like n=1 Tax=Bemisia tabaci TaxID=7038 RepID=UPI003B28007B